MQRRNEEAIGEVLLRYLRASQLEAPLNEYRLLQSWAQVAGEMVSRQTKDLKIRNQTLHVSLRSAVLRSELSLRRAELVRRLNEAVGAQVITDIKFC